MIADGWYHVFARGTEKRPIFLTMRDRARLLELLAKLSDRYRVRVHAYALMDNHYHALLQTPEANLSAAMQWFHGSYAAWFNAKHERVGPLFQGRFRAIPLENASWAFLLSFYVHLNPIRVRGLGLDSEGRVAEARGWRTPTVEQVTERLARLRAYRWSSYRAYAGYASAPPWLETASLLEPAHRIPERRRTAYRKEARWLLAQGVDPARAERLRDAVAIGSAAFALRMRRATLGQPMDGISGQRELRRRLPVAELRRAVEALMEEPWEAFRRRYGHPGCALFLWGARHLCGLTLREAGKQAGGMPVSTTSTAIRRFESRADSSPATRSLIDRLTQMTNE